MAPPDGEAEACELIVVRHGETDWNRAKRLQGGTDIELNARGLLQAERSAEALAEQFEGRALPRAVHTSELQRASATGSAIATALSVLAAEGGSPDALVGVVKDARLNEWNLGVLEGLTKTEAAEKHAEDWSVFSCLWSPDVADEIAMKRVTGGESMEDLRLRAVDALNEVCAAARAAGEPVIVVAHGGLLGQLLRHALRSAGAQGLEEQLSKPCANACICRFLVEASGCWQVVSWGETGHLDGDAAPVSANYDGKASLANDKV